MLRKLFFLFVFAVFFVGCREVSQNVSNRNEDLKAIEDEGRSGDTTLTGTIVLVGDKKYLVQFDGTRTQIDSYTYELSEYANLQVVITGQYSSDTLFVGQLEK